MSHFSAASWLATTSSSPAHGNHISAMRVDRAGRVVAFLDDGSTDSAPNVITPGLRMPDTVRSVLREDWKFLTAISACARGSGA